MTEEPGRPAKDIKGDLAEIDLKKNDVAVIDFLKTLQRTVTTSDLGLDRPTEAPEENYNSISSSTTFPPLDRVEEALVGLSSPNSLRYTHVKKLSCSYWRFVDAFNADLFL